MANLREIQNRINSVQGTMQVTRTMEMISTAKVRKALERAQEAEPYKDAITRMLSHVASASSSRADAPLLARHETVQRVLFILIASDRGMAGGFNIQLEREVAKEMDALSKEGIASDLITCGKKPTEYFAYRGVTPVLSFTGNSSEPTMEDANRISSYLMDGYVSGRLDRVLIYYWHAKNRVDQVHVREEVLPLSTEDLFMPSSPREEEAVQPIDSQRETEFEFEPSANSVLGFLLPAYLRTVIFHALLDSAAAEHGARMRAMRSATDSAREVITALSRTYNRERQGSITTELNEIVAGASALEDN